MTEKPIEITEDDIWVQQDHIYGLFLQTKNFENIIQAEIIRKQILQALEFYKECGKVLVTINPDGSMKVENLITDKVKQILVEYPKLKEKLDTLNGILQDSLVAISKLQAENEDLQSKLDGDAVTFINLQKEIIKLKQIKQRIQSRIDSMSSHDLQSTNGLTAEGHEILGMLHNFLKEVQ